MLKLKMAEKLFQRRESSKLLRASRNQKSAAAAAATSNILEAIAQISGGDAAAGPRRMKILVRKEDLEHVMEAIRDGRRLAPASPAAALEQRLNVMRRRQILRAAWQGKGRNRVGQWRPVLQSIPEEL